MDLSVSLTEYVCCYRVLSFCCSKCYLMLQCGQSVPNLSVSPIMALFIRAWPWKDNLPLNLAHFWILVQYAKLWPRTFGSKRSRRLFIKLCHWVPKGSIFLKIDQNQLSFLFGFYLKIRERKKLERKKVRAQPLCHLNNPPTNPFELLDISMLLYHKETGHLDGEAKLV